MKFNEFQEVYNTTRQQVEIVKLGDVSYIITCRVMQTNKHIQEWEHTLVKYQNDNNDTMVEWCQGRIEGLIHQREALKECLRLIEKTSKM